MPSSQPDPVGLAHSATELIIARGLQGVFAALLAPAAPALPTVTFPSGRERGTAFAVFGTVAGTGAAVGLAPGGVLTRFASRRWCLLVNIVFAVVGLVGALVFVTESKTDGDNRYDLGGAVTVTLGLGSPVYGSTLAEAGWTAPGAVVLLALGLLLLASFVRIESRVAPPLLPLRVVRDRVRAGALLIQAVVGAVFIGMTLYLAFRLQVVLGLSPLLAGLASLGMTPATMTTAPVATRLFARFGARVLMTAGPLVAGVGIAFTIVPLQNAALAGVAPHDAGAASALVNSVMRIGGCIALSVFTTLYLATAGDAPGGPSSRALTDGYAAVLLATAVLLGLAALVAATTFREHRTAPSSGGAGAAHLTSTG